MKMAAESPNSKAMAALEKYFKVSGEFLRGEVTQHEYLKNSEEILQNFDGLIEQFKTFMNDFDTASQSNQKLSVLILIGNLQVLTDYLLHSEKSSNLNADEICKIFQAAFDLNDQGPLRTCQAGSRTNPTISVSRLITFVY